MQHITRMICCSRTYQLSVETNKWNEDDSINFSHAVPRRLPAETLLVVYTVTDPRRSFLAYLPVRKAASLPDVGISSRMDFLALLAGPPVKLPANVSEVVNYNWANYGLVSGPTVNDAISDPNNAIAKIAK